MLVKAVIEMPKGTKYKYEYQFEEEGLYIDRVLDVRVPQNYGFIPDTKGPDGDALDVFVVSNEAIPSLTTAWVSMKAIIRCEDNGIQDDKYVGTLHGDNTTLNLDSILEYLNTYKTGFKVLEVERLSSASIANRILHYAKSN